MNLIDRAERELKKILAVKNTKNQKIRIILKGIG